MKKTYISMLFAAAVCLAAGTAQAADYLKPFVLAYTTKAGTVQSVTQDVMNKLKGAGFEIAGSYSPYPSAEVIAVTSESEKKQAAESDFGGYGAAQRVAVTQVKDEIQVSYTNPTYMANVYRMATDLTDVASQLEKALGKKEDFGADPGLTKRKLRKYHYLFGMEYFDDLKAHHIATHKNYEEAVKVIEANLAKGLNGVTKVYRIDIPGKKETVFGVAMKAGKNNTKYMDDQYIMNQIDFKPIRSTAHLPYEILVNGNKTYSLYARFRIAIDFPDLSMMGDNSFMRIMESPEAIKRVLTLTSGGDWKESYWQ